MSYDQGIAEEIVRKIVEESKTEILELVRKDTDFNKNKQPPPKALQ